MRFLGVFVTDEVTIIQNPSPKIKNRNIQSKFLQKTNKAMIPNIYPQKSTNSSPLPPMKAIPSMSMHLKNTKLTPKLPNKNGITLDLLRTKVEQPAAIKLMQKLDIREEAEEEDTFLQKYYKKSS